MTTPERDANPVSDDIRFDRRLANRRGWVAPAERDEYLQNLPDVSDKIEPPAEQPSEN